MIFQRFYTENVRKNNHALSEGQSVTNVINKCRAEKFKTIFIPNSPYNIIKLTCLSREKRAKKKEQKQIVYC